MKQWKKMMAAVLGIVIGITICSEGISLVKAAQTYYVSYSSGSDSNVGTSKTKAFKTLKKAVNSAEEGDNIRILDTLHQTGSLSISKGVTIGRAADMVDYMIVLETGAELTLRGSVVIAGRKGTVLAEESMIKVKEGATLNIKGSATLKNNSAESQPGGAVYNLGTMNVSGNCVINGNVTGSYGGGAIYNVGTLNVSGGTIQNNVSGKHSSKEFGPRCGGGVLNAGSFVMTAGVIMNNTSIGGGGGIHNTIGAVCRFSGGSVVSNESEGRGGGINCSGGVLTMTGGEVSENCSIGGGGISLGQEDSNTNSLYSTISGGTIKENKSVYAEGDSTVGSGGGILVRDNNILTISGGNIINNIAENCGGGVRVGDKGTVIIDGAAVNIGNNSAKKGGGIQVKGEALLKLQNGTVKNNEATQGGGIQVRGECKITGGSILSNVATKGNAIYHNGTLSVSGSVNFGAEDDIYLYEDKYVVLPGNVNNLGERIVLTPSNYTLGRICARTTKVNTIANAYSNKFVLAENRPYLLRPGNYLSTATGVASTDLIISRTYSLTYNANIEQEVKKLPDTDSMYWKETYVLSGQVPEWSEMSKFIEWNTKKDGSGTVYMPGATISLPTNDLNLYAQWSNLPPELSAKDSYLVEDEIEVRLTKAFLKSSGKAVDFEEGDISKEIKIANWDEILLKVKEPYSKEEKVAKERHIEVIYTVQDSCGAADEKKATLTIFLLEEDTVETEGGYVRFLETKYIESIEEDTFWGSEEKKAYLMEILEKDTSDIEWEN